MTPYDLAEWDRELQQLGLDAPLPPLPARQPRPFPQPLSPPPAYDADMLPVDWQMRPVPISLVRALKDPRQAEDCDFGLIPAARPSEGQEVLPFILLLIPATFIACALLAWAGGSR